MCVLEEVGRFFLGEPVGMLVMRGWSNGWRSRCHRESLGELAARGKRKVGRSVRLTKRNQRPTPGCASVGPVDAAHLAPLFIAIGIVAFLYSSVGHAGASGYIAVMTLFGIAATTIRPTALILNILVATIGSVQFARAGYFRWRLFWPFALLSVPAAYLGGYFQLPVAMLRILIGLV